MTQDESKIDTAFLWWADAYAEKAWVRALFIFMTGLVPASLEGASGLAAALVESSRELMASAVEEIRRERQRTFFDELAAGEIDLTEELIQKEDFLHAIDAVYRAAMRTYEREKIQKFARLLLFGVRENRLGSDEMEEFVAILDDLSPRELDILMCLKKFEDAHPRETRGYDNQNNPEYDNELQRTKRYWDDFSNEVTKRFNITSGNLNGILARLNRTGLYQTIIGAYFGYTGNKGFTTDRFKLFIQWIASESATNSK